MSPDPVLHGVPGSNAGSRACAYTAGILLTGVSSPLLFIFTFKYLLFPFLKESKILLAFFAVWSFPITRVR